MAKVVLGIGSSHGPQLGMPPDLWWRRGEWDKGNPELWYQGRLLSFAELRDERADEHFERELTPEKMQARFDACQRGIATLADTLARVAPDLAVIVGDDQHESFLDDNMPAFSVYWGETVDTCPPQQGEWHREVGSATAWGRFPEQRTTNPCEPSLGRHLIESFVREGFDAGSSCRLPAGRSGDHGLGHAFSYVYRRLMNDEVIPNVPIFLNTYFPPNQPTLQRCYELGRALGRAIESWASDKTVAIIASGGLSHFVIEEDFDQQVIAGLKARDATGLTNLPLEWFNSGNSEIRNWIVAAGAVAQSGFEMQLIDYVPCYRSEAGTGCAMAFAQWA